MNTLIWLLVFKICVIESSVINNKQNIIEQPRIFWNTLGNIISSINWLPFEINIPDTASSVMQGLGSMWETMSLLLSGTMTGMQGSEIDYDPAEQQIPVSGGIEIGTPSVDYEIIDPGNIEPINKISRKKTNRKVIIKHKKYKDNLGLIDLFILMLFL